MSSSETEDCDEMREKLQKHLESFLDAELGSSQKKKKKAEKAVLNDKINQDISKVSPKTSNVCDIGKIKKLTESAKSKHFLSNSTKLLTSRDIIHTKVKGLLDVAEQTPKPDSKKIIKSSEEKYSDNDISNDDDSDIDDSDDDVDDEDDEEDDISDNDNYDDIDVCMDENNDDAIKTTNVVNKRMEKFKSALGITATDVENARQVKEACSVDSKDHQVKTLASLKKRHAPPTVFVFDERKPKSKPELNAPEEMNTDEEIRPEFSLKRARYEVQRLGISGFDKVKKEASMVDILVKLGAKPPKRASLNYKVLQEKLKQDKEEAALKLKQDRKAGFKVKKVEQKLKRGKNEVQHMDGQVGCYKRGVQVIPKNLIKDMKNSINK